MFKNLDKLSPSHIQRVTPILDGQGHSQIIDDLVKNGNKSQFKFLLQFDKVVLKDLDELFSEKVYQEAKIISNPSVNSSLDLSLDDVENFDFHEFKESLNSRKRRVRVVKKEYRIDKTYRYENNLDCF